MKAKVKPRRTTTGAIQRAPQVSGYSHAGASTTRRSMRSFRPDSRSPTDDILRNASTLRQRSRMLYMSSSVATAAINTVRTKSVGTGLVLNCAIDRQILGMSEDDAKEWQRHTEAEFWLWASKARNCDALGINNFCELQQLAMLSWLQSGDVFPLFKRYKKTTQNPYTLRIHLIEADRVRTPSAFGGAIANTTGKVPDDQAGAGNSVYDGVEVDEDGLVTAYYISKRYPGDFSVDAKDNEFIRVEVSGSRTGLPNILHLMSCERPDQYRGVPYLAPVIEALLQLRRYTEAQLMTALIQSLFTAWIETEDTSPKLPFSQVGDGLPNTNPGAADEPESETEYQMGTGTVIKMRPGEKVTFGNPTTPTTGFDAFIKTFCRQIGAALELPYDVLIKEFNSSYSASRGALLEAWEAFKMRRRWFADGFCQPIYEVWLAEAVALGRIRAPGFFADPLVRAAWCGANWIGPVQGQLDPLKEAKAQLTLISHGIKTHEQVTREMSGGDFHENVDRLRQENELLQTAGARQNFSGAEDGGQAHDEGGNEGEET